MAVLLMTASFLMGTRLTPNGIHCPTAAVQLVASSDGLRVPFEKEKGFEQCRCRERKAKAEVSFLNSGVMLEYVLPQSAGQVTTPCLSKAVVLPAKEIGDLAVISATPLSPPPDWV
jgi:hypothetical protein